MASGPYLIDCLSGAEPCFRSLLEGLLDGYLRDYLRDYFRDYWRDYLSIVEPLAVLAASIMTKDP